MSNHINILKILYTERLVKKKRMGAIVMPNEAVQVWVWEESGNPPEPSDVQCIIELGDDYASRIF